MPVGEYKIVVRPPKAAVLQVLESKNGERLVVSIQGISTSVNISVQVELDIRKRRKHTKSFKLPGQKRTRITIWTFFGYVVCPNFVMLHGATFYGDFTLQSDKFTELCIIKA